MKTTTQSLFSKTRSCNRRSAAPKTKKKAIRKKQKPRKVVCTLESPTREQLIERHIPYAKRLAKQFLHQRANAIIDLKELQSAAYVGLCEAANRYETGRHANFVTFSYLRIRGSMYDYLCHSGQRTRAQYRQMMREQGGYELNPAEKLAQIGAELSVQGIQLYTTEQGTVLDLAAAEPPERRVEEQNLQCYIRRLLPHLAPNEREVIRLKYLQGLTLDEIRATLGMGSKSLFSRLHSSALQSLRDLMASENSACEQRLAQAA